MDKVYIARYPEGDIHMEPEPFIHRVPDTRNSRKKRRDRATWHKKHQQLLQQLSWKEFKITARSRSVDGSITLKCL